MSNFKQKYNTINAVHKVLAHSYSFYFLLLLLGVFLDVVFSLKIFSNPIAMPVGFIFLILATIMILWAQKTGRDFRKIAEVKAEHFCRGPYCYTRNPTHWGLLFMMLGFGIIANAVFVVLFTLIYFFVAKFIFLSKEEKILAEKYGSPYLEYKKLVRF